MLGDHAAFLAATGTRRVAGSSGADALEERLLELHLLQRLRLDDELAQARLDGVLRGARGDAVRDEEDGGRREDGDEDLGLMRYTLMSTMRRMKM